MAGRVTLLLDLGVNNAYALFTKLWPDDAHNVSIRKFKRRICELLLVPLRKKRKEAAVLAAAQAKAKRPRTASTFESMGCIDSKHILVTNQSVEKNGKKRTQDLLCRLCSIRKIKKKSIYGCIGCRKAFCVDCFAAYHYRSALSGNSKLLMDLVVQSIEEDSFVSKPCKTIGSLNDLKLPAP